MRQSPWDPDWEEGLQYWGGSSEDRGGNVSLHLQFRVAISSNPQLQRCCWYFLELVECGPTNDAQVPAVPLFDFQTSQSFNLLLFGSRLPKLQLSNFHPLPCSFIPITTCHTMLAGSYSLRRGCWDKTEPCTRARCIWQRRRSHLCIVITSRSWWRR